MRCVFVCLLCFYSLHLHANNKTLYIYQDADLSRHDESSESIQKGIEVAFDEIGNTIDGYNIAFKYLDHRGNVIRSKRNYKTFIEDQDAIAIYSGIHSPPLIKNRTFINENKALTLVPWAAGSPITRYPSEENWVFRLSIDDMQAGEVIIDFAMNNIQCKRPNLLLEDTPWGDSNLQSMSKVLLNYGVASPDVTRFDWNTKRRGARAIIRKIVNDENDCIVLVGNAIESIVIVQALLDYPVEERLPIISHWGLTAGDFHEKIDARQRENLSLHFIQSCFAFTNATQSEFSSGVFSHLASISKGAITKPSDLKSAAGFIHAYDLTKLLIQAIRQAGLTGNMIEDRNAIRRALENINQPVKGLSKTYINPFSVFNKETNINAHEALHKENYCMGKYGSFDEILIVK